MSEQNRTNEQGDSSRPAIRWLLTGVLLLVFVLSAVAGALYHPWDTFLEKSGVSVLEFKNLGNQIAPENLKEDAFFDRVDLIKYKISQFLFSDSADSLLAICAKRLLSPIEDTAKTISMAIAYSGTVDSRINPAYSSLALIVFILLFYLSQFGKNAAVKRLDGPWNARGLAALERKLNVYCVEGAADFLFLFVCYWAMTGLNALRNSGAANAVNGAMNSGNPLIALPMILLSVVLMVVFILLVIALFLCAMPYYTLMALPVFLVALLPLWVWMPIKLSLCLVMEFFIVGTLFPWLYERLNMWNTLKAVCRVAFYIPYILTWPIRKLFGLFF